MNRIQKFFHWVFGVRVATAPAPKVPEVKKTIKEWLVIYQIPNANIFNWHVPDHNRYCIYQLEDLVTRYDFAYWYRKASDYKEFIRNLK